VGGGMGVGVGCSVGAEVGVGVGVGVAVGVGLGTEVAVGVGFGAVDGAGEADAAGALGAALGDGEDEPWRASMTTIATRATAITPIRMRSHVCMLRSRTGAPSGFGGRAPGPGGGPCGGNPCDVGCAGWASATAGPASTTGGGGIGNTSVGGRGAGPSGLGDPGVCEGPLIRCSAAEASGTGRRGS